MIEVFCFVVDVLLGVVIGVVFVAPWLEERVDRE